MIKKNRRRIDPRYFLNETAERDNLADDLSPLDSRDLSEAMIHHSKCPGDKWKADDAADQVGNPSSPDEHRVRNLKKIIEILGRWGEDVPNRAQCIEDVLINAFNAHGAGDEHMRTLEFAQSHLENVMQAGKWIHTHE